MSIIYILENKINKKKYVGQTTKSLHRRIIEHKHTNSLIGKAIKKYGEENFEKTIIEVSYELLNEEEIKKIAELNTIYPNGYNLTTGGEGIKNPTKEVREKIGRTHRGKIVSLETRKKMSESDKGRIPWNKGKKGLQIPWNKGLKKLKATN